MSSFATSQTPSYDSTYGQVSFLNKVFAWMASGLALTAVIAYMGKESQELLNFLQSNPLLFIGLIIAELALVFFLAARIEHISSTAASIGFFTYAALNGVTLSLLLASYTDADIVGAFVVSAGMFAAMAAYGYVTKRDLSKFGSLLFMALIGLIIASVVNIFIASTALYWIVTYAGVLIFCGLTAYDMQRLKEMGQSGVFAGNLAILGALQLYLDFINLFIYMLRIFGGND